MYKFDKENHLHTFDGKQLTGISSVMSVLAKPLTWWASGLACETLGWTRDGKTKDEKEAIKTERLKKAQKMQDQIKTLKPDEYLRLLDTAYAAHSKTLKKAADKGTDLHSICETYLKTGEKNDLIKDFILWSEKNVKKYIFSEAHSYSETLFCGGISDGAAIMKNGKTAIIDFKSAKEVYQSHLLQCAGYALLIEENGIFNADGKRIFKKPTKNFDCYIVIPFGSKDLQKAITTENNTELYKSGFKSALNLYRILNNNFAVEEK